MRIAACLQQTRQMSTHTVAHDIRRSSQPQMSAQWSQELRAACSLHGDSRRRGRQVLGTRSVTRCYLSCDLGGAGFCALGLEARSHSATRRPFARQCYKQPAIQSSSHSGPGGRGRRCWRGHHAPCGTKAPTWHLVRQVTSHSTTPCDHAAERGGDQNRRTNPTKRVPRHN
jgi:hypothetical protein